MVEEEGKLLAGELDLLYFFRAAVYPHQADAHEYGRNAGDDVIDQEHMVDTRMLLNVIEVIDHAKAAVGKKDGNQHECFPRSLPMNDADLAIVEEEEDAVREQEHDIRTEDIGAACS